jgi:hypothetical protein
MIFFDNSYMDYSLKTRIERQRREWKNCIIRTLQNKYFRRIFWRFHVSTMTSTGGYGFRRKTYLELKRDFTYKLPKPFDGFDGGSLLIITNSFDNQIADKGAIVDNQGNIHTTAQSYKNYLKENDLVIKDWSDGSLNRSSNELQQKARKATRETLKNFNYI